MKILKKIVLIFFATLISLFNCMHLVKQIIYDDFYAIRSEVCDNPGLNDGFICQGIAASEKDKKILVGGYMSDKTNSRIYVTDLNSNSYYVSLEKNGKSFTGHCGGIAVTNNDVYVASGNKIYTISLKNILQSYNGDVIDIGDGITVNNSASFVYSDNNYLYVGEFHDGGKYVCNHIYETNEGTHSAIISKYSLDDLNQPIKIYSIRNKVQGVCFTPNGDVVFSTSYGLADSIYYVYKENEATNSNLFFDGAPVYFLDNCTYQFNGPAMGEDLDYYNGKIITLTESASNKYIFGKIFFANKIIALDL